MTDSTKVAAARCHVAAGPHFDVVGPLKIRSSYVYAELPPDRNPGADDTEWIMLVELEGTPEKLGKILRAAHEAAAQPEGSADELNGFE